MNEGLRAEARFPEAVESGGDRTPSVGWLGTGVSNKDSRVALLEADADSAVWREWHGQRRQWAHL